MIFSGKESDDLWRAINKISRKKSYKKRKRLANKVMMALYALGCRCQKLETALQELKYRK